MSKIELSGTIDKIQSVRVKDGLRAQMVITFTSKRKVVSDLVALQNEIVFLAIDDNQVEMDYEEPACEQVPEPSPAVDQGEMFQNKGEEAESTFFPEEFINEHHQKIVDSYSGDTIFDKGKIRDPFEFEKELFVCTAIELSENGEKLFNIYKLVLLDDFTGESFEPETITFEKAKAMRDSGDGPYHSVIVKHRKNEYVLCGPPITAAYIEKKALSEPSTNGHDPVVDMEEAEYEEIGPDELQNEQIYEDKVPVDDVPGNDMPDIEPVETVPADASDGDDEEFHGGF